jgi:cell cycle sensor histidine kinase DivJ
MRATTQGIPSRHSLFRRMRLTAAALTLMAFPVLVAASGEPPAVAVAVLLMGLLPAVIALDVTREADLDRAVVTGALALSALLAAAALRGLPLAAVATVAVAAALELHIVCRRPLARAVGLGALVCAAALAAGASLAREAVPPMPATMAVSMALGFLHLGQLALGLAAETRRRGSQHAGDIRRLADIESLTPEIVLGLDSSGAVLRLTGRPERVLGLPESALAGRGLMELTLVADRPALLTTLSQAAGGGFPPPLRFRLRAGTKADSGPPRYRHASLLAVPGHDGGSLATLRDVEEMVATEHRAAEAEAVALRERGAREAFLSTVNHELRTPLNAIVGFSELLANPATSPADPARVREYAGLIHGAGHDLLRMVNAMIDITRLDAGAYDLRREPTDLATLAASVIEQFATDPAAAGYRLALDHDDSDLVADVDSRAVRSILQELLSNAARFGGGQGGIRIRAHRGGDWLQIGVTDPGKGLAPDIIARLGEAFAGGDQAYDRAKAGMGLGLALAQRLAARHGGALAIAATPGAGATVTLRLPARNAATVVTALSRREPGGEPPQSETPRPKVRLRA